MIAYYLGGAAAAFLVFLVVGGITGRVRTTSCCSIADPTRDARMRDLYQHEPGGKGWYAPPGSRRRHPTSQRQPQPESWG